MECSERVSMAYLQSSSARLEDAARVRRALLSQASVKGKLQLFPRIMTPRVFVCRTESVIPNRE